MNIRGGKGIVKVPDNGGIDNLGYCKDCASHPLMLDRVKRACKMEAEHDEMNKSIKQKVPWFVFIWVVGLVLGFVAWDSSKHSQAAEARHLEIERIRTETNENMHTIKQDIAVIKNELEK